MNMDLSNPATLWAVVAESVSTLLGLGMLVAFLFKRPAPRHKWKVVAVTLLITLVVGSALLYSLYRNTQASTWTITLQDYAPGPGCYSAGNPTWVIPESMRSGTTIQCPPGQGMVVIPLSTALLAEIDLDQVNGQIYSQSKLDVQVKVTFEHTGPDPGTLAGLAVQTPQHGVGGYFLAITNTGYWELGDSKGQRKANAGLATPRSIFIIRMKVQQGTLYGWIDGQQVFTYRDTLNPSPGAIALVVYGRPPLSSVSFSDFLLKL